ASATNTNPRRPFALRRVQFIFIHWQRAAGLKQDRSEEVTRSTAIGLDRSRARRRRRPVEHSQLAVKQHFRFPFPSNAYPHLATICNRSHCTPKLSASQPEASPRERA